MKEFWNKPVEKIKEILLEKNAKLCIVETVTGGQLTTLLTSKPNSSQYLAGSLITQNESVISSWLKLPADLLKDCELVSETVTAEMSYRMCDTTLESDYGIAITGVTSLNDCKLNVPVGTMFVSLYDWNKHKSTTRQFLFPNPNLTPQEIIDNTITETLIFIINFITTN